MKTKILKKLEKLAFDRTIPFCMSCYVKASNGVCPSCHTDDLARLMEGVGLDWSLDFAIKHILNEELSAIDLDEVFEDSLRSSYPETTSVGWMNLDTIEVMKAQDPISFRIARDEYIDSLESDEEILSFDNGDSYYWINDLEAL